MCGWKTDWNHVCRPLENVLCGNYSYIRQITRKFRFFTHFGGKFQFYVKFSNFCKRSFLHLQIYLTFKRPTTPKFRGGNDFHKTLEIRQITPKVIGLITTPSCKFQRKVTSYVIIILLKYDAYVLCVLHISHLKETNLTIIQA